MMMRTPIITHEDNFEKHNVTFLYLVWNYNEWRRWYGSLPLQKIMNFRRFSGGAGGGTFSYFFLIVAYYFSNLAVADL